MSVYFNFLNPNQYFFYTLIKVRLNYSFGLILVAKYQFGSSIFYLNLVLILENIM